MDKEEKRKIIILIFFIIFVSAVIVSLTYAFFYAQSSATGFEGKSCFDISYVKGQDVEGELNAGTSKDTGFYTDVKIKMASSCNTIGKGTLYLTTKENSTMDFTDNALKYSIVVNNTVVKTGSVNGTANQILYDNFTVNTTDVTYRVYIWLDSSLEEDDLTDELYYGFIHASVVSASEVKS